MPLYFSSLPEAPWIVVAPEDPTELHNFNTSSGTKSVLTDKKQQGTPPTRYSVDTKNVLSPDRITHWPG